MQSTPTNYEGSNFERMNDSFVKLHASDKIVHIFSGQHRDEHWHDHNFRIDVDIIAGSYTEEVLVPHADGSHHVEHYLRVAGTSHTILASTAHRITGLPEGFCVTQAKYGPNEKTPGFYEVRPEGIVRRNWNEADWRPLSA